MLFKRGISRAPEYQGRRNTGDSTGGHRGRQNDHFRTTLITSEGGRYGWNSGKRNGYTIRIGIGFPGRKYSTRESNEKNNNLYNYIPSRQRNHGGPSECQDALQPELYEHCTPREGPMTKSLGFNFETHHKNHFSKPTELYMNPKSIASKTAYTGIRYGGQENDPIPAPLDLSSQFGDYD